MSTSRLGPKWACSNSRYPPPGSTFPGVPGKAVWTVRRSESASEKSVICLPEGTAVSGLQWQVEAWGCDSCNSGVVHLPTSISLPDSERHIDPKSHPVTLLSCFKAEEFKGLSVIPDEGPRFLWRVDFGLQGAES
jgi:hypothetical protein